MNAGAGYVVVLAHAALLEMLPAVIPMGMLVAAFAAVVGADRRRTRSQRRAAAAADPDPG